MYSMRVMFEWTQLLSRPGVGMKIDQRAKVNFWINTAGCMQTQYFLRRKIAFLMLWTTNLSSFLQA